MSIVVQAKFSGHSFQTRFCVLRGSILLYYVDHHHKDPKGVFLLDECKMLVGGRAADRRGVAMQLLGNLDKATSHTLTLQRPSGAQWELCAANEHELQQWVDAFTATGVVKVLHPASGASIEQSAPSTPPPQHKAAASTPGGESTATLTPVAPEHRPLPYTHEGGVHGGSGTAAGVGGVPAAPQAEEAPHVEGGSM